MQHIVIFIKKFGDKKKHRKVRDHDHYTGKYRGATHSICNLRYSAPKDIPVLFHNGTNYDFNLIITELAEEFRSELQCIPVNTNRYIYIFLDYLSWLIVYLRLINVIVIMNHKRI